MTISANQIVIGGTGNVYVNSTSGAAPTDSDTTLGANWINLGYTSEDGATFTEGKEITDIMAWQSFYPVRRIITSRTVELAFTLRQFSEATLEFALGGTVSANGAGEYKYEPPSASTMDLRSIILEVIDGTKNYRIYIPEGLVTGNVETNFQRAAAADLPITFSALDQGGATKIYTVFSNDSSMATQSS